MRAGIGNLELWLFGLVLQWSTQCLCVQKHMGTSMHVQDKCKLVYVHMHVIKNLRMFMPLCARVCGTRRPRHSCACTPHPHTHTQNHSLYPPPPTPPSRISSWKLCWFCAFCIELHFVHWNDQFTIERIRMCLLSSVKCQTVCNVLVLLVCLQPERFVNLGIEPPKGVLLFGPPGTGKTLCARAVANRTDACFIRVIGSELVQKYVGEVRQLRRHQGESWVCESRWS